MRIEISVPKDKNVLSFIINYVLEEEQKGESVKRQIFIGKDHRTFAKVKKELDGKNVAGHSKDSFVADWKDGTNYYTISFSLKRFASLSTNDVRYILVNGTQVYRFTSEEPEEILVFSIS